MCLRQSGPQGTCRLLSDNTDVMHGYSLLIVFAVSLFLFLSHKVVVLLEIQVDLLAYPIFPIRTVNKAYGS